MAPSMGETSGLSPAFTTAGGGGRRHTFGETEPAAGGVAPWHGVSWFLKDFLREVIGFNWYQMVLSYVIYINICM